MLPRKDCLEAFSDVNKQHKQAATMKLQRLLFLTSACLCGVQAEDVYYDWTLNTFLDNKFSPDCMNDQMQGRFVFVAEESSPGPTIDVMEGDAVHVSQQGI